MSYSKKYRGLPTYVLQLSHVFIVTLILKIYMNLSKILFYINKWEEEEYKDE